jgi:hypothetical protein
MEEVTLLSIHGQVEHMRHSLVPVRDEAAWLDWDGVSWAQLVESSPNTLALWWKPEPPFNNLVVRAGFQAEVAPECE